MDPLFEEEIMAEESSTTKNPFTLVGGLLMDYGWPMLGLTVVGIWLWSKLQPKIDAWRQAKEDAEYHKDPDRALARMEAIQRAREKQQQLLIEASQRALEAQAEREEKKRAENLERLEKYGATGGQAVGAADGDYLPLSGGASTSSYRPPKKSKCGGGGCGR